MEIFICRFCDSEKHSKKSLIAHETFCKSNPNAKKQNTEKAREKAAVKYECLWCQKEYSKANISKHENSCDLNPKVIKEKTKICPVCGESFFGVSFTCSYSCSNRHFRHSRIGGAKYKSDNFLMEKSRYRELCFRHHDKKCVVCGEENIVEVHHLNEDHNDHRPENMVPLCPTHHQYYHSKYRKEVGPLIDKYIKERLDNIRDEEAGSSVTFGA